jgi:hypothetical protein
MSKKNPHAVALGKNGRLERREKTNRQAEPKRKARRDGCGTALALGFRERREFIAVDSACEEFTCDIGHGLQDPFLAA